MVVRTLGSGWLALMMRAERRAGGGEPDTEWRLHGPTDPDLVEAADDGALSMTLLAAE